MFLKKWNTDVVNWDELIQTYNIATENDELVKINLPGFFVCHNAHLIYKVQKSMKKVAAIDAHAYFNISVRGKRLVGTMIQLMFIIGNVLAG